MTLDDFVKQICEVSTDNVIECKFPLDFLIPLQTKQTISYTLGKDLELVEHKDLDYVVVERLHDYSNKELVDKLKYRFATLILKKHPNIKISTDSLVCAFDNKEKKFGLVLLGVKI